MDHLAHPFDDAFFAALAGRAGIARDDLPSEYDPGCDWGNDGLDTPVPGMPGFTFMAGDDEWFGRMALYHDGFDYRRLDAGSAEVVVHSVLTQTQITALPGMTCSSVVDAPCIGSWLVTEVASAPDDADETVIMLAVP